MSMWNGNRFSVYTSEEKSVLGLIMELETEVKENNINLELKTDKYGDHKGSWQGLNRPTISDEGMRATVEKIIDEDLPSINTEIESIKGSLKEKYYKYRYIATSFNYDEMKLVIMYSNDGINWEVDNPNGDFVSSTGNKTLRDPAIIKIGEWFYIIYTKIAWGTGSIIGSCRTKNLIDFIELEDIKIGNFNKLWAPEFFHDSNTDKYYIVFSGSSDLNNDNFKGYLQEITFTDKIVLVGQPILIKGDNNNKSAIDFSILEDANRYYLLYKNEELHSLCVAESFNLLGEFKDICNNKLENTEGHQAIKTESGYRIYFDEYQGAGKKLCYVDVYDSFKSFGNMVKLNTKGFVGSHMFVLDNCKIGKNHSSPNPACIMKMKESIIIESNKDTILSYDTVIAKSDIRMDKTDFVIPCDGFYNVNFSLAWQDNNNGTRTIAIEHKAIGNPDFTAISISQINAAQNTQTAQNISALIYCYAGDKVRTVVTQNSGNGLMLVNWGHSVVFSINKI